MYYPEDVVEEVRTRNDIVDVISGYVKLQKKGANYFGLCPFHNEKSPSFSVSPQKQMYYCFGCGAGGNAITFIMEYENYTFPEALKVLADRAGVHLPEIEYSREERAKADKVYTPGNQQAGSQLFLLSAASAPGKARLRLFSQAGIVRRDNPAVWSWVCQ